MPTRTYTGLDFINYLATTVLNNGTDLAAISPFSQFNVAASSSGSASLLVPGTCQSNSNLTYNMAGDLDFDAFPAIPANASITKVEVQVDVTGSATAIATVTGLDVTNVDAIILLAAYTFINAGELPLIRFEKTANVPAPGELIASAAASGFDHYTNVQTFDYSGAPITKAQLVIDFTNWLVQLRLSADATAVIGALSVSHGTSTETASLAFDGIRITVTYESGLEITLSPTGGNIEIGDHITATGPGASDLTYAILQDDLVIPLIPKIISETEVLLEIPIPPTDPCLDCFGDCPNCDTCFDVCDEDITGEACQACIEACLACLTECLENLQLAEECQASIGVELTDPVPIVIIVGGPGFSGSVVLGNFVILVANGSGIYRFTLGKANDTLYSASRDGSTYDVKIPNPGGKTGFFRS